MPFVWDAGGAELSEDNTKSTINSPEAVEGVTFLADLVKRRALRPGQLERDGTQVENQFKGGKLAVWMGGPWVLGSVEREDDENWVAGGAQERRHRADAGGPQRATRSRSWAART